MADNVVLNAGAGGDTVAADDIGGVKHQLVKLEYGAPDSATPVSPANPLPVAQLVKSGGYQAEVPVLGAEMNALANNANSVASSTYDNSANRYPFADVVLTLATQASSRATGGVVLVFMVTSTDGGVTFDDVNDTTAELVATFPLDVATAGRRRTVRGLALPPGHVRFFARNQSGQAMAAAGNVVRIVPYYDVSV